MNEKNIIDQNIVDERDNDQDFVLGEEHPLKAESRRDERFVAFHLIYALDRFDYTVSLDDLIQDFKDGFNLDVDAESFAYQLAHGVVEQRDLLDEGIKPFLKNWKLERLGCCTRLILRMALWELRQPDAIVSIVINEAVELAKAFAEKDSYKFINGILDEICKTIEKKAENKIEDEDEPKTPLA
ncbi:transcription antitermination factor NusB [Candidatus Babeliales bacterium]|nr:transcription antitermination factor NusB [Candidatus Babeliales bacterium]MBY0352976.1 transcription antitermination factor NusB [Candidatus Babeliales bacterium]